MIQNSFIFLEKIGPTLEKRIWKQHITTWHQFLYAPNVDGIAKNRKIYFNRKLQEAQHKLFTQEAQFFASNLKGAHHWRLYDYFKDQAVFLDIETTGIYNHDDVTVIGLFDGTHTKIMIRDINLDINQLREELARYKLIVTFNGASFDIPFLKKRYENLIPNIPHFDICSIARRVGLSGGLKQIEKKLGIKRTNPHVKNFNGGDAVTLWKLYKNTGDKYYLNLLVEYNEEDIINLKYIANYATKKLKEQLLNINST